jgi:F0F1-type ATP synthase gamma subunit
MDPKQPELQILLGSDLGFCGNLNNLVRRWYVESDSDAKTVIIGRKLNSLRDENTLIYQTREEFSENHSELMQLLSWGLRKKQFSAIRLVYNHYHNSSEVEFKSRIIFPMPKGLLGNGEDYTDDFVCEGDMQELLLDLTELYLDYEVEIASQVSLAAENITRQNITTESIKKIDEREEEAQLVVRREQKDKEFAKVLDNYTKLRHY